MIEQLQAADVRPESASLTVVIGCMLAAAAACFAGELLAFAATTLRPAPENLSLATLWDARPTRWWSTPLFATVIAVWLPRLPCTPGRLLHLARGHNTAGRATLGLALWCVGATLFIVWLVFASDRTLALIMFGVVGAIVGAFALYGAMQKGGVADRVSAVFAAALIGVVLAISTQGKPRTFDCAPEAGLKLKSDEAIGCRSVDWLTGRQAVLARRADGSTWIVAKSALDPAALIPTLGQSAVTLYPIERDR